MKTVFEHVKHIQGKPHHVRKRVAFAAAAGGTALIALVWLVGSFSMGAFALKATSFADIGKQQNIEATNSSANGPQNLAGVAAALLPANKPAHIEIVDTASSTRSVKKAEQTTIPF